MATCPSLRHGVRVLGAWRWRATSPCEESSDEHSELVSPFFIMGTVDRQNHAPISSCTLPRSLRLVLSLILSYMKRCGPTCSRICQAPILNAGEEGGRLPVRGGAGFCRSTEQRKSLEPFSANVHGYSDRFRSEANFCKRVIHSCVCSYICVETIWVCPCI